MKGIKDVNDANLTRFREIVLRRLTELEGEDELGTQGQATVELDQQAVGRLSRMDALQSQAMAKATAARRGAERVRLGAALKRMDEGEFGFCEDCGEEIANGRLEFDPAALRCLSCQRG